MEETMLRIIGRAVAAAVTTCRTGGPDEGDTQEQEPAPSEEEEDEKAETTPSFDLTLASTSSETDTVHPLEARLEEGSACGETPTTDAQDPERGERIPQVQARWRARSFTSSAVEESDEDFDGLGYRRRLMDIQNQMLSALESLPGSLCTMSRGMEELQLGTGLCTELRAHPFPHGTGGHLHQHTCGTHHDAASDGRCRSFHCRTKAAIASLSDVMKGLQATVEAQTAAIVTLGTTMERASQGITALQQSVLQLITRSAEASPCASGSVAMAVETAALSPGDSILAPTLALLLPISPARLLQPMPKRCSRKPGPPGPELLKVVLQGHLHAPQLKVSSLPPPMLQPTGDGPHRSTRTGKGT
ncbi:uncharacterized protein [Heptranchias perlo]|uniref:uncharacterized protein n=1 Tax=Heptranchias perlo TaxID=212740 RepID=UPI003559FDFA